MGESLDVAPLALGVQGIERERGFARATDAGDDDQLVERQFEIEILEIILASAADADGGGHAAQAYPQSAVSAPTKMFHHQPGAAARDVRDDRRASMDFSDQPKVNGERQLHLLAFVQAEAFGLHEHTIRAEVPGPADPAFSPR